MDLVLVCVDFKTGQRKNLLCFLISIFSFMIGFRLPAVWNENVESEVSFPLFVRMGL